MYEQHDNDNNMAYNKEQMQLICHIELPRLDIVVANLFLLAKGVQSSASNMETGGKTIKHPGIAS